MQPINLLKKYGFFGFLYLSVSVFRSKFLFRNARIIRFPFDLRGKKHIRVGKGFTTGRGCRIEATPPHPNAKICIEIGPGFQMNDYCHIAAAESIKIGSNVLCASKIFITDLNHGSYDGNEFDSDPHEVPSLRPLSSKAVVIGDNVWLGEGVTVLQGADIGYGAIIGSHSVVNSKIPPMTIAVGIPAKVIKKFDPEFSRWIRTKNS